MEQVFQLHIVWTKWGKYSGQVQMTSCDANPDGGEEGGTQGGEAIPKFLDI